MKKFKLTKVLASLLIAVSVLALNPVGASAAWKSDNNGWWYTEGNSWATGWRQIDGLWYYFYTDGYMAKDTTIDGYYLNLSGAYNGVSEYTPEQALKIAKEAYSYEPNVRITVNPECQYEKYTNQKYYIIDVTYEAAGSNVSLGNCKVYADGIIAPM